MYPEHEWVVLTSSDSEIEVEMIITNLRSAGLRAVAELQPADFPGSHPLDKQRWHINIHRDDENDAKDFLRSLSLPSKSDE